jgi:hypothetical protein
LPPPIALWPVEKFPSQKTTNDKLAAAESRTDLILLFDAWLQIGSCKCCWGACLELGLAGSRLLGPIQGEPPPPPSCLLGTWPPTSKPAAVALVVAF